jgi:colanic acid/amylovoran biosynthesis protein
MQMENEKRSHKILLIGLTSTSLGSMEFGNIGNFTIIDPLAEMLRKDFPASSITTTIQLSDEFCYKHKINRLSNKRFWQYGYYTLYHSIIDIIKLGIAKILNPFSKKLKRAVIQSSKLLNEIYEADLVIDFSGDIFGDYAKPLKFVEGCVKIWLSKKLNKKVAMIISSPGPFKKWWRRKLALSIMNRVDLITNREPISTEIIKNMGVENENIHTTSCPSYFFKGYSKEMGRELLQNYNFNNPEKILGFIITGWNMPEAPYTKIPRSESEIKSFVELIESIIEKLGYDVLIMSHSNRLINGEIQHGNDYYIAEQIYNAVNISGNKGSIHLLREAYDAKTTKAIVSNFNILISGRLHGAVAGLTQLIPTIILDYGHEPKAHKLKGFAVGLEMGDIFFKPDDNQGILNKIIEMQNNCEDFQNHIHSSIERNKILVKKNIELLKDLDQRND